MIGSAVPEARLRMRIEHSEFKVFWRERAALVIQRCWRNSATTIDNQSSCASVVQSKACNSIVAGNEDSEHLIEDWHRHEDSWRGFCIHWRDEPV